MPYADEADTAWRWATERAISCWAWFRGDLDEATLGALHAEAAASKDDGATWVMIIRPDDVPSPAEHLLADEVVVGTSPPAPWGIFTALQAAGACDVRRMGVLGSSRASLNAAHRAGAGAVIGIAANTPEARQPLLPAQPDVIVAPDAFAALDAERYASDRAHRQRVLLNPGPSVVSDRVHRAVGGPDLCHREPEYSALLNGIRRKLLQVADVPDDWALVMLAGSGTAALEAMTGAATRPGKKLLVCKNGIYGERVETIARRLWHPGRDRRSDRSGADRPRGGRSRARCRPRDRRGGGHPPRDDDWAAQSGPGDRGRGQCSRHPVPWSTPSRRSARRSSICNGTGIDFVASTSNKCLHGLPGAAFILVSPRGQERIARGAAPLALLRPRQLISRAQDEANRAVHTEHPGALRSGCRPRRAADEGSPTARRSTRRAADYLDEALARLGSSRAWRRSTARARCARCLCRRGSTTTPFTTG